jgi:hypothetical protein
LYAGDADYICNWYGIEAVSLAIPWSGRSAFNEAGYTDFMVDEEAYGQVRQAGNLTFLRVWNAGHEVPYYQPEASLEMFQRMIRHREMADGVRQVTDNTSTTGTFLAQPVCGQHSELCLEEKSEIETEKTSRQDKTPLWKKYLRLIWRKVTGFWSSVDAWLVD